jgi:hypothetical protein
MTTPSLVLALALVALTVWGCSAAPRGTSASAPSSSRTRCLVDPRERDTRPLVYLLCIESP